MTRGPYRQHPITNKQRQILVCMANGLCTKEISDALKITGGTIETYKYRMYKQISVQNGLEAVAWGFKNKYLI